MAEMIGEIAEFVGNYRPSNFLDCDGEELLIKDFTALFSIVNARYGGDGKTHFKLPDLRPPDPTGHHNRQWIVGQPRWVICFRGLFPSRD